MASAVASVLASRVSSCREASSLCGPVAAAGHAAGRAPQQQQQGQQQQQVQRQQQRRRGARQPLAARALRSSRRRLVAAAAAEAEAAEALVPDRQGYRAFLLEGCEFLVAESEDGRLDLADTYVTTDITASSGDRDEDAPAPSYRRPAGLDVLQPLPAPQQYQPLPWYSHYPGDAIADKPPKDFIWRYYLVPVATTEPELQLNLDGEIFALDSKAASLSRCEVHRLAPPDTPLRSLRLRIREDVITIDTAESIPCWEQVVRMRQTNVPALSKLEVARLEAYLAALEEARQMGTIDETEFQTAYDVTWLAGMRAGRSGVEALSEWQSAGEERLEEGMMGLEQEADVMGGWDQEMFEDLMQQEYDEEAEEEEGFDDFDSPAADF